MNEKGGVGCVCHRPYITRQCQYVYLVIFASGDVHRCGATVRAHFEDGWVDLQVFTVAAAWPCNNASDGLMNDCVITQRYYTQTDSGRKIVIIERQNVNMR